MEIFAFTTDDVEYKLYDILSSFHLLEFSISGLRNMNLISEYDLNAFDYILKSAIKKTNTLVQGMKPILVGDDRRIVLVFCDESPEKE